jgi:hypothetical protein
MTPKGTKGTGVPYKAALTPLKVLEILQRAQGTHFSQIGAQFPMGPNSEARTASDDVQRASRQCGTKGDL